jgi:hypothetical protein
MALVAQHERMRVALSDAGSLNGVSKISSSHLLLAMTVVSMAVVGAL